MLSSLWRITNQLIGI